MGLKTFSISFSELSYTETVRLRAPFLLPTIKYKYVNIDYYLKSCESGTRPKGGIQFEDNGEAISLGGEQINIDGTIDLSKIPYVPHEYYENSKKGKVKDSDVLICKDGALTGKSCFVNRCIFPTDEVMVNEHIFILRGNEKINQKFLYYYTITTLFQDQVKDLAYRKKAQPGLNSDHLKKIKMPCIPIRIQNQILEDIAPIENKIERLKKQIKDPEVIINQVFAKEFQFNARKANKVDKEKYIVVSNDITFRNYNLRSSFRWNKIAPIQKILYENNPFIEKLGRYITSTKNGWSPNCGEINADYYVLGVNSISKSGAMNYDNLKSSDQSRKDISEFFVKEGDLFVSRGNTIDLVALASIAWNIPIDMNIIFPDLLIRIEVDEKNVLKTYLAYLLNSMIGRFYFKYSAKGKNQTMVKISSDELLNFYLPIPPMPIQNRIVNEIKEQFNNQEKEKQQITLEKNEIKKILEKAIYLS